MMKPEKNYGTIEKCAVEVCENGFGEKFWEKPENILRLIDLIFFFEEEKERLPS